MKEITLDRGKGSGDFQVLLYHGLYRDPREIRGEPVEEYVSAQDFARQVRWMRESGHTLLSLSHCRRMAQSGELPPRSVCVTFDDGKQSDLEVAVPVLMEAHAVATFFIIPDWLGNRKILGASQIRELAACGMEVGSHSLSHPFLTELDAAALERETAGSRRFLEDLLGLPVESFSYPYGDVNDRVRQAVAHAGYGVACGTRRGRNPAAPEWLLLRRWGIPGSAGLEGLRGILSRTSPTWGQAAVEALKRAAGTRRFTSWKGRWARRVQGAEHE